MKSLLFAALAAGMVAAAPAQAVVFTYSATTAGGPVFNRPISGDPPNALSAFGTAVAYNALRFTVDIAGSYVFLDSSVYDNFMILYQGSFTPTSPLTNALVANDDVNGIGNAGFTRTLSAGVSYIAVMTSFDNAASGAFTLTINGPGTVTPTVAAVPEPASWAMMIMGLGMAGAALRRRVRTTVTFA